MNEISPCMFIQSPIRLACPFVWVCWEKEKKRREWLVMFPKAKQ